MEGKWVEWVKQIQAIAQAGLTYSKDVYDIERFQQLRDLSISNHVPLYRDRLGSGQNVICK